ncbi:MAG: PEP-CTERM sorting domain-containing protein [Myxococcota bacterium]
MRFNAARGLDRAFLVVFVVASGAAAAGAAPAFRVIDVPPVPDPRFLTIAAVARDSGFADPVIVGGYFDASIGDRLAFRWRASEGLTAIDLRASGLERTGANHVSEDGRVVIGGGRSGPFASQPFIWTIDGGGRTFGPTPLLAESTFDHVSGDGRVAFGTGRGRDGLVFLRSSEQEEREVIPTPWPSGADVELVGGISATTPDGSVAVGSFAVGEEGANLIPVVWSEAAGYREIPVPGTASEVSIRALSESGSTAAGSYRHEDATFWSAMLLDLNGELRALEDAGDTAAAYALSGDASVVAGFYRSGGANRASVWLASNEYRLTDVADHLAALGVELRDFSPEIVRSISSDGRTLFGTGSDSSGTERWFAAVIPEPSVGLLLGLGLAFLSKFRRARLS